MLLKASSGGSWVALSNAEHGSNVLVADITSFSYFVVRWCKPDRLQGIPVATCVDTQQEVKLALIETCSAVSGVASATGQCCIASARSRRDDHSSDSYATPALDP